MGSRRIYAITAAGIAKLVAVAVGCAPLILAVLIYEYYKVYPRPESELHILIRKEQRQEWEFAYLIVVAAGLAVTVINLGLFSCFRFLSSSTWTKRIDCGCFTVAGVAQAAVGFVMVASALTSSKEEPIAMKYAAGFLGIATGIVYWATATLVNRD